MISSIEKIAVGVIPVPARDQFIGHARNPRRQIIRIRPRLPAMRRKIEILPPIQIPQKIFKPRRARLPQLHRTRFEIFRPQQSTRRCGDARSITRHGGRTRKREVAGKGDQNRRHREANRTNDHRISLEADYKSTGRTFILSEQILCVLRVSSEAGGGNELSGGPKVARASSPCSSVFYILTKISILL